MQIPTVDSIEVVLALTVGLATIGVCVFCALTSVGALFYFCGDLKVTTAERRNCIIIRSF